MKQGDATEPLGDRLFTVCLMLGGIVTIVAYPAIFRVFDAPRIDGLQTFLLGMLVGALLMQSAYVRKL